MASKSLTKDTPEYQMFGEYYQVVQKYYTFETTDEYWDALVKECDEFYRKWKDSVPLSRELAKALINYQERMYRGESRKDG